MRGGTLDFRLLAVKKKKKGETRHVAKANLPVLAVHRSFAVQFGSEGIVGLKLEI